MMDTLAKRQRAVLIVGAAFPRSGTASVMRNQVEYYRSRGYVTVFLCVATHCSLLESNPDWQNIRDGMEELGADHTFFAAIDERKFKILKYFTWIQKGFRGTALDWIVFTGKSARLRDEAIHRIQQLQIAAVHVNHVITLGFVQKFLRDTVRPNERVPVIVETHDVLSQYLHGRGEVNPWTHGRDHVDRLLASELSYLRASDVLVHVSVDDFNFFKSKLPKEKHVLVMPTIDESLVSEVDRASETSADASDLLFVGTSTDPNRVALEWFFEQVWPLIEDRGYHVKIIGQVDLLMRNAQPKIYQKYRSCFVGPIAIGELRSAYRAAGCVIAPMVSGTGISIKTIEALALGKPFVGTPKAYRGMPMELILESGIAAYDSPQDFADGIVYALSQRQRAGAASRRAYDAVFSKQAAFTARDEALKLALTS